LLVVALIALPGCGGASGYTIKLQIVASTSLKPGAPVRILGQRHGTVDDVTLSYFLRRRALIAKITLDQQAGPLHVDATAVIHTDGIDLQPGTSSQLLVNGGTLPPSQIRIARPSR
jgi:ABC-type transporter Mla subunit MlaD